MSKVLLINTLSYLDYWKDKRKRPKTDRGFLGIPLGLLSLGTSLFRNGYAVKVIDPMVQEDYMDIIKENLDDTLWVGVSTMTNGVASALQISRYIKSINKNAPICWGGVHPTLFPESVVQDGCIDYVCWGEGERFCVEFSEFFQGRKPLEKIEGLYYTKGNQIQFIPRNYFLDINDFGIPNYDLLDMDKYLYAHLRSFSTKSRVKEGKFIAVNTGIGCPYKCTFCWNTHPSQKYRIKTIENLIANLDYVVKRFDPDAIHLQDDLFFADRSRFLKFLEEYDKRNYRFQWLTNCRVGYICDNYINDGVLDRIKGQCIWLGIGVESGSDKIREKLNKQLGSKQIYEAARLLGKHNMIAGYAFMTGLPYENLEDTIKTIKMMKKIKRLNPTSRFAFQCFRPYPGSALYEESVRKGFVPPSDIDGWSILQDITSTGGVKREILPWIDIGTLLYFEGVVEAIDKAYNKSKDRSKTIYLYTFLAALYFKASFNLRDLLNYWGFLTFEGAVVKNVSSLARRIYRFLQRKP